MVKLWAVLYKVTGQKFTLIDRRLFSEIILFKTAKIGSIFRRESLIKPAKSKVAVLTL